MTYEMTYEARERTVPFNEQIAKGEALDADEGTFSKNQFAFDIASAGIQATAMGPQKNDDGGATVLDRPPETKNKDKSKAKRPSMYKVLLHNDNETPFDFVVQILRKHFNVGQGRANMLMMTVHQTGEPAVVALYSKEIAEAKTAAANSDSRSQGHPLTLTCEKDG